MIKNDVILFCLIIKNKRFILNSILMCFYFCVVICSVGCMTAKVKPEIVHNSTGVTKIAVSRESIKDSDISPMGRPKEYGYSESSGKKYMKKERYPISMLYRLDDQGNIVWSKSTEGWPTHKIGQIITHESGKESLALVLLQGNDYEYLVILSEKGETKKIAPLIGSANKEFLDMKTFKFKSKDYILVNGFEDTMIFDFDGQLMAALKTPIITGGAAITEIPKKNGRKYLGLYVEHQLPTRSATIFILSETMEVVYQEVVAGRRGLFIGKQASANGEDLIIVTYEDPKTPLSQEEYCKEDPMTRYVYWRYKIGR